MAKDLNTLVDTFYNTKSTADSFKKDADKLNKEIKQEMKAGGLKNIDTGKVVATYGVQERTSMNRDKLLKRLKDLGLQEAIKTVEVPNETVVEDLIYKGHLDASKIQDCIEVKEVEVLRIKKAKGAK